LKKEMNEKLKERKKEDKEMGILILKIKINKI
jgi:hypothetical protein